PIVIFWSETIAPIFYGETFGAEVVSNPSWLVNIGGATVLRAFSLFPDPHMFSFYLGLLIPIALARVIIDNRWIHSSRLGTVEPYCKQSAFRLHRAIATMEPANNKHTFFNSKSLYFIFIIMLLAELLTFSRGGYLGLIAGIGAVIILSWRYISFNKKIILGFAAGIFVLFIMFSNQSIVNRFLSSFNPGEGSNSERMKNWSQGWEVFNDNVLTGVGIGNYSIYLYPTADYRTPIYAHNLYLDIGAEMGIFALIVWLALIAITIYQLFKLSRSANDNFTQSISLGLIGSLIWFSIHGFFDTPIYSPTILAMFMIILSLAVMVLENKTQKTNTIIL
ncbi:MAG: O-antigen ligase family protein, partial [Minisyncoccia bacterium]